MGASKDERSRILHLVEAGQVTAVQASQLLDALESDQDYRERPMEHIRDRTVRIRATRLNPKNQRVNITGAMPVSLLKFSLRLGARLLPQLSIGALEDLLYAIESGATGRLLDLQDLEKGERLEIFVE